MNTFSTNGFKSELSFLLHYYLFIHLFKTLRSCSQHNLYPFCFYSTRLADDKQPRPNVCVFQGM